MLHSTAPARYVRFLEDAVREAIRIASLDVQRRQAAGDEPTPEPLIPDEHIIPTEAGDVHVLVFCPNADTIEVIDARLREAGCDAIGARRAP
jgi:hypothetical protein